MKLPYVKYVRQAKDGPDALVQYLATLRRAYERMMLEGVWTQAPGGEPSKLPPNQPIQTESSPAYDAYMFVGDCPQGEGKESAFVGMAAYIFKIPDAAQTANGGSPTSITGITIKGFSDKFLWKGAQFAWTSSASQSVPSEVMDTFPYAGISNTGTVLDDANSATKLATNKYQSFALYAGSHSVSGKGYIIITVQLVNYLECHWEYWIEGGAALDAPQCEFTFAHTVTPDATPVVRNADLHSFAIMPLDAELSDATSTTGTKTWDAYRCHLYSLRADVLTEPYTIVGGGDMNARLIMDRVVALGQNFGEETYVSSPVGLAGYFSHQGSGSTYHFYYKAACKRMLYNLPVEFTPSAIVLQTKYLGTQGSSRVIIAKDARAVTTVPPLSVLARLQSWYKGNAYGTDIADGLTIVGNIIVPKALSLESISVPITGVTGAGVLWVAVLPEGVAACPLTIPSTFNSYLGDSAGYLGFTARNTYLKE